MNQVEEHIAVSFGFTMSTKDPVNTKISRSLTFF